MRKTSMIMGIVGGALAILFGLLYSLGSSLFFNIGTWQSYNTDFSSHAQNAAAQFGGTIFLVLGIIMIIGGILGLVGGLIVKKKNTVGGVLMIIAAVLGMNLFSIALFIIGAVFALKQDRSQMYAQPPYPYPPYPPYPPQAYTQGYLPAQGYAPQPPAPPQNPPEQPQP